MIQYLQGDATRPIDTGGPRLIVHICNSVGGWGRGFVVAISKRWPEPERCYRRWFRDGQDLLSGKFQLGAIQVVPVMGNPPLSVVNMIAQEGYGRGNRAQHYDGKGNEKPPVRYDALANCLREVNYLLQSGPTAHATVHMPRIGCGLGGGRWDEIEPIIERELPGASVYVYDPVS